MFGLKDGDVDGVIGLMEGIVDDATIGVVEG